MSPTRERRPVFLAVAPTASRARIKNPMNISWLRPGRTSPVQHFLPETRLTTHTYRGPAEILLGSGIIDPQPLKFRHTMPSDLNTSRLVICEHCDTVHERAPLQRGETAYCQRCGSVLYRQSQVDLDVMMAITAAAAIMFVIANAYPIVSLDMQGLTSQTTLWETLLFTLDSNVSAIAVLAAGSAFFFPLIQILLFAYLLIPLRAGHKPYAFVGAMHALRQLRPWSMVEVFMLGAVVSVVKLTAVADVTPQAGLWGFAVLTLLLTLLASFDLHELWERAMEPDT